MHYIRAAVLDTLESLLSVFPWDTEQTGVDEREMHLSIEVLFSQLPPHVGYSPLGRFDDALRRINASAKAVARKQTRNDIIACSRNQ